MKAPVEEIYSEDYFNYLHDRSPIRKAIRRVYLNDIRKYCIGKTIDFGCGVGELLKILPQCSIGFEVNRTEIDYCRSIGLHVEHYDPATDNYHFRIIPQGVYSSFTMNHVLEHLDNSHEIIK